MLNLHSQRDFEVLEVTCHLCGRRVLVWNRTLYIVQVGQMHPWPDDKVGRIAESIVVPPELRYSPV